MRVTRLGKIFDPTEHRFALDSVGYAQSPQVLVKDNSVRIYFSTRCLDSEEQFVSHVAYVDMTRDLRTIIGTSVHEVISQGDLGSFDEHGIFPFHVLPVGDAIYAYTCGWSRRVSVPVETGIGLAISRDQGNTFNRVGTGPIMTASLNEPFLVGDAFVRPFGSHFHMWYIFGQQWKLFEGYNAPERIYKIGHATSDDGINWTRKSGHPILADRLGADESQALPTVIQYGDRYHMFFCYRESVDFRSTQGRGYRLGYAVSEDLISWDRRDDELALNTFSEEWDRDMQCYPHAFECDGRVFLLYNGNEFGKYGFGALELSF